MSDRLISAPSLAELQTHRSEKWRGFTHDILPLPVAEMDFPVADGIREVLSEMISKSDFKIISDNTSRIPSATGKSISATGNGRMSWVKPRHFSLRCVCNSAREGAVIRRSLMCVSMPVKPRWVKGGALNFAPQALWEELMNVVLRLVFSTFP